MGQDLQCVRKRVVMELWGMYQSKKKQIFEHNYLPFNNMSYVEWYNVCLYQDSKITEPFQLKYKILKSSREELAMSFAMSIIHRFRKSVNGQSRLYVTSLKIPPANTHIIWVLAIMHVGPKHGSTTKHHSHNTQSCDAESGRTNKMELGYWDWVIVTLIYSFTAFIKRIHNFVSFPFQSARYCVSDGWNVVEIPQDSPFCYHNCVDLLVWFFIMRFALQSAQWCSIFTEIDRKLVVSDDGFIIIILQIYWMTK